MEEKDPGLEIIVNNAKKEISRCYTNSIVYGLLGMGAFILNRYIDNQELYQMTKITIGLFLGGSLLELIIGTRFEKRLEKYLNQKC